MSIDPYFVVNLTRSIRSTIANVVRTRLGHELRDEDKELVSELARNSAHAVLMMLDTLEVEDACPLCGTNAAPDASIYASEKQG